METTVDIRILANAERLVSLLHQNKYLQQSVEVLCEQIRAFQTLKPIVLKPGDNILMGFFISEVSVFQKEILSF